MKVMAGSEKPYRKDCEEWEGAYAYRPSPGPTRGPYASRRKRSPKWGCVASAERIESGRFGLAAEDNVGVCMCTPSAGRWFSDTQATRNPTAPRRELS